MSIEKTAIRGFANDFASATVKAATLACKAVDLCILKPDGTEADADNVAELKGGFATYHGGRQPEVSFILVNADEGTIQTVEKGHKGAITMTAAQAYGMDKGEAGKLKGKGKPDTLHTLVAGMRKRVSTLVSNTFRDLQRYVKDSAEKTGNRRDTLEFWQRFDKVLGPLIKAGIKAHHGTGVEYAAWLALAPNYKARPVPVAKQK